MKPIPLLNQLPPSAVMDLGEEEVWWFDKSSFSWTLGSPLLFDESSIVSEERPDGKYTHWLPIDAIPLPPEDEDCV